MITIYLLNQFIIVAAFIPTAYDNFEETKNSVDIFQFYGTSHLVKDKTYCPMFVCFAKNVICFGQISYIGFNLKLACL